MMNNHKNIILVTIFGAVAFMAANGVLFTVHDYRVSLLSAQWPQTSATIHEPAHEGLFNQLNTNYIYHFAGLNHRTQKVRFFTNHLFFNPGSSIKYRPGDVFTVYVNPQNHAQAVIVRDSHFLGFVFFLLIGAGGFFISFGCLLRCTSAIASLNSIDLKPSRQSQQ